MLLVVLAAFFPLAKMWSRAQGHPACKRKGTRASISSVHASSEERGASRGLPSFLKKRPVPPKKTLPPAGKVYSRHNSIMSEGMCLVYFRGVGLVGGRPRGEEQHAKKARSSREQRRRQMPRLMAATDVLCIYTRLLLARQTTQRKENHTQAGLLKRATTPLFTSPSCV